MNKLKSLESPPESIGDEVLFEVKDHIATVLLNRPQKRNAINGAVTQALDWSVKQVEHNDDIRVAILGSTSEISFSAGADLKAISSGEGASLVSKDGGFAGFVAAEKTKPWIAAVPAAAFGGGFELALACDLIVAAHKAEFGLPEVKRGLIAAAGGVFLLPQVLPRNLAMELIATGNAMSSERAQALGLVNHVVENGVAVIAKAHEIAVSIAQNAPLSVKESMIIARKSYDLSRAELWADSNQRSMRVTTSKDATEGAMAFLEKRKPVWSGG